MGLANLRVLGICLAAGAAIGGAGGLLWGLLGTTDLPHGIATGILLVGLVALALGLLGATEPPQGWAARRRGAEAEGSRRSLVGRVSEEHSSLEPASSLSLAVWGVVVGGGLIGLSMLLFALTS